MTKYIDSIRKKLKELEDMVEHCDQTWKIMTYIANISNDIPLSILYDNISDEEIIKESKKLYMLINKYDLNCKCEKRK